MEGCTTAARPGPKQLCQKHGGKEPRRTGGTGKSGLATRSEGMVDGRWLVYSDVVEPPYIPQASIDMIVPPPQVSDLTLAVEDGKEGMFIWRVDKDEEEIVLNALGEGFVLLDIPPQVQPEEVQDFYDESLICYLP